MFNRQFSLLVIVGLLLSTDLVHANEIDGDRNVSVGNVQIRTTPNGTVLQTPKIQVSTPKATGKALTSRNRRRVRTAVVRPKRQVIISNPSVILPQQVGTSAPPPTIIISTPTSHPTTPSATTSTPTSTPTVQRSTTIRTSTNGSESVSTQQQSIQCSSDDEGSSSVSQSTSTVNGRTVRSETRTNCR
jgi:hypothetical protein